MKQTVILIAAQECNSGYVRTAHLFSSVEAAKKHIKEEMECDEEELQDSKEDTLSPDCECYVFEDEYIYHIYTNPTVKQS